jgi:hypothetical protein
MSNPIELFWIHWTPAKARQVADLIYKQAAVAEKLGPRAFLILRFMTDADAGQSEVTGHVAVALEKTAIQ